MWKCSYAEENVDIKLFCLKMLEKTSIILMSVLLGAVLLGGLFYLKEAVFSKDKTYQVVGEAYMDYIPEEGYGISRVYITDEVWAALVKSDDFVKTVKEEVSAKGYMLSEEYIRSRIQAGVISDSRIVTTTVTSANPEEAVAMSAALQKAILDFCSDRQEIAESFVMTAPEVAEKRIILKEVLVASLIGAVLGLVIVMTVLSVLFFLDDSVDLPVTFERRYKIPMFGTLHSEELLANLKQFCKGCDRVAVISTVEEEAAKEAADLLQKKNTEIKYAGEILWTGAAQMTALEIAKLKEMSGVILVIAAGRKDGKRIEKLIDFLKKQQVMICGAVLWDADEALISRYYSPGILKKGKDKFVKNSLAEKKKAEDKA